MNTYVLSVLFAKLSKLKTGMYSHIQVPYSAVLNLILIILFTSIYKLKQNVTKHKSLISDYISQPQTHVIYGSHKSIFFTQV